MPFINLVPPYYLKKWYIAILFVFYVFNISVIIWLDWKFIDGNSQITLEALLMLNLIAIFSTPFYIETFRLFNRSRQGKKM